jgi:hypothetical protein
MTDEWHARLRQAVKDENEERRREIEAYNHWLAGVTLAGLGITLLAIAVLIWLVIQ